MIKSLQKVGNSRALILDKTLLEQLGIREQDQVQLTVTGQTLQVSVAAPTVTNEEFDAALEDVMTEYDQVLKNLAK